MHQYLNLLQAHADDADPSNKREAMQTCQVNMGLQVQRCIERLKVPKYKLPQYLLLQGFINAAVLHLGMLRDCAREAGDPWPSASARRIKDACLGFSSEPSRVACGMRQGTSTSSLRAWISSRPPVCTTSVGEGSVMKSMVFSTLPPRVRIKLLRSFLAPASASGIRSPWPRRLTNLRSLKR